MNEDDETIVGARASAPGLDRTSANNTNATTVTAGAPSPETSQRLPSSIGKYRILRLLGEGGMGAVYEAEQDQPRRHVALKVIRAAYASPELLRRFEQESQALGRLHHPGIAQIYEAGSADAGFGVQPFFAMELIHGKPLVEYADEKKLNLRQRLELMIQVCDAVQHAHQRGIIHRDLKPGNILVDESGQPKILDFGLARATDSDAQATRQTDMGQLLGTLAYMSPEQVLADPLALDTRSDVYALGVILYELLAGKLPYTLSRQLHEAVRTIQETDPAPLGTIHRIYRGDIETIVAKALEKDKNRRYASANGLAADIRRYLDDQPIAAKPASTMYQLQKFARRNKALVAGVGAVFAVLVLGIAASGWEAVQARRAAEQARLAAKRAEQESAISQAVNDFLQKDLLGQASAYNQSKPDPNITVKAVLNRAAQNIQGKFAGQPAVEAAIRQTIGTTYDDMGLYPEAERQLQAALALSSHALGDEDPKTLSIQFYLAGLAIDEGKYKQAEALEKKLLDLRRRVLGPEHVDTLQSMRMLAAVQMQLRKGAEAEALNQKALDTMRRVLGPEDQHTLGLMNDLAGDYEIEGKYAQAETLHQEVLEICRRVLGPEHPATLMSMDNLSIVYSDEGKYAQAETLRQKVLETRRRVLGPEHPDTLKSMSGVAWEYQEEGKYAQAETLQKEVLAILRRVLGPEHPDTLTSMISVAMAYDGEGKHAQAVALIQQVIAIQSRILGPEDPETLRTMGSLAASYDSDGKLAQAEALYQKILAVRRRVLGPVHRYTIATLSVLASDYSKEGKFAQADDLYRQALKITPNNAVLNNTYAWRLSTAEDLRFRRPEEALDLARKAVSLEPQNGGYLNTLGLAEVRNGLWDEAIATLTKSIALNNSSEPTDFLFLAMAYQGHGDKADAEKNYAHGAEMAREPAANDPDIRTVWTEAAKALGKPAPKLTSTK